MTLIEELLGVSIEEIEQLERRERAWIGLVVSICVSLLAASAFLLALSYRVPL